ncbi:hypothetical protein LguiB_004265 [Lonicera macranthoides]
MKLGINPKRFFGSKKSRSVSRSDQSWFSSGTASSSSSSDLAETKLTGEATPTSVLPRNLHGSEFDLEHAFKIIDRDGNGLITKAELEVLFSRVGSPPSEEELTMMVNELDRNGDGCISLEEFGAIGSAFGPPACDDEMRVAFEVFDTDHDGKITAEELLKVFTAIGDEGCTLEDCRRMISGVDKNGDGFVCFEDFRIMMEQQR